MHIKHTDIEQLRRPTTRDMNEEVKVTTKGKFEHPLVDRYASKEMSFIWSPEKKFSTWRKLWLALAQSEQALGKWNQQSLSQACINITLHGFSIIYVINRTGYIRWTVGRNVGEYQQHRLWPCGEKRIWISPWCDGTYPYVWGCLSKGDAYHSFGCHQLLCRW